MATKADKEKAANSKRQSMLTFLKRKNYYLADKIKQYISRHKDKVEGEELAWARGLTETLIKCSSKTLYAQKGKDVTLVSSMFCGEKLCNVCNWNRQKSVRIRYMNWFKANKTLLRIGYTFPNGRYKEKVISSTQLPIFEEGGWEVVNKNVPYDLMHLTLTVPHTVKGWRAQRFYFKEIMRAFNFVRKYDAWLKWVYGGEFGVEATKNDDGYHIHIHALLFVRRERGNRNNLHREILRLWNHATVDAAANRQAFTQEHIDSLLKGNKTLTPEDIDGLDPRGSTMITLENIFYINPNGKKVYVNQDRNAYGSAKEWERAVIPAILETISYHFKPNMFRLDDEARPFEEEYDIQAIIEVYSRVYRQQLYKKFGCLHGDKTLNSNYFGTGMPETAQIVAAVETDTIDTETGEVLQPTFFVANPKDAWIDRNDNIHFYRSAKITYLKALTLHDAVLQWIATSVPIDSGTKHSNNRRTIIGYQTDNPNFNIEELKKLKENGKSNFVG